LIVAVHTLSALEGGFLLQPNGVARYYLRVAATGSAFLSRSLDPALLLGSTWSYFKDRRELPWEAADWEIYDWQRIGLASALSPRNA